MGSHVLAESFEARTLRLIASVAAPPGTRLRLLLDGATLADATDGPLSHVVDSTGVYRVEAILDSRFVPDQREQPWIVSNPIYVLSGEEAERRRTSPLSIDQWEEWRSCQKLGEEPWRMAFHPEHDPASRMDAQPCHRVHL